MADKVQRMEAEHTRSTTDLAALVAELAGVREQRGRLQETETQIQRRLDDLHERANRVQRAATVAQERKGLADHHTQIVAEVKSVLANLHAAQQQAKSAQQRHEVIKELLQLRGSYEQLDLKMKHTLAQVREVDCHTRASTAYLTAPLLMWLCFGALLPWWHCVCVAMCVCSFDQKARLEAKANLLGDQATKTRLQLQQAQATVAQSTARGTTAKEQREATSAEAASSVRIMLQLASVALTPGSDLFQASRATQLKLTLQALVRQQGPSEEEYQASVANMQSSQGHLASAKASLSEAKARCSAVTTPGGSDFNIAQVDSPSAAEALRDGIKHLVMDAAASTARTKTEIEDAAVVCTNIQVGKAWWCTRIPFVAKCWVFTHARRRRSMLRRHSNKRHG